MNIHRCGVLGMLALVVTPAVGIAQDKPTTGLTVTTPTAVGLIWHLSDRVALRPDFVFSTSSVGGDISIAESSASSYTLGVGGLFYVREWDQLRTYVSPRFSYTHASTEVVPASGPSSIGSTSSVYGFAGSFGADYSLARHFAVFAETGLGGEQGTALRQRRPQQ